MVVYSFHLLCTLGSLVQDLWLRNVMGCLAVCCGHCIRWAKQLLQVDGIVTLAFNRSCMGINALKYVVV